MRRKKQMRILVACVCLLAVLVAIVSGAVSYIVRTANPIPNTFVPASVSCQVEEVFDGNVKENVSVRNTGNISAYIRAIVIVNWVEEETGKIYASAPEAGVDYQLTLVESSWIYGADGYWYYPFAVAVGASTDKLIRKVSAISEPPEGFQLQVQILASAIQSDPSAAVSQAWGVAVVDSCIYPATSN